MAVARRAFVALVCAVAVGSLATDLWTLDLFGPQVSVFAALPLLSYSIVGAILVVRRAGGLIGWLLGGTGVLMQLVLLSQAYGYASLYAGAALPGGEVVLWSGSVIGNALLLLIIPAIVAPHQRCVTSHPWLTRPMPADHLAYVSAERTRGN